MEYQEEDYWPLTLAYAITVHKAQGSEYPMAILPMLPCFRWMLRRNIFYTAVTRARERFIIVGSKRAIAQAIRTVTSASETPCLGTVSEKYMKQSWNRKRAHKE